MQVGLLRQHYIPIKTPQWHWFWKSIRFHQEHYRLTCLSYLSRSIAIRQIRPDLQLPHRSREITRKGLPISLPQGTCTRARHSTFLIMQYENQFPTRMSISFTHRPKTIDVNKKKLSYLETPEPGRYDPIPMTPSDGRPRLSKHRTVKLSVINKDTRFKP